MGKNEEVISVSDGYEAKISKLYEIVGRLESDVSLEEGMKLFEQGLALTKECIDELNKAQQGVSELKDRLDKILDRGEEL